MSAHLLQQVDRRVALNATRPRLVRVPDDLADSTKIMLDMAAGGVCGDPLRARLAPHLYRVADAVEGDDDASAQPLRDLAWVVQHESPATCAGALGAAWRARYPFRAATKERVAEEEARAGVLVPHFRAGKRDDRAAVRALDLAAQLPTPPVAIMRNERDVQWVLDLPVAMLMTVERSVALVGTSREDMSMPPFREVLALTLLGIARHAAKELPPDTECVRYMPTIDVVKFQSKALRAIDEAKEWVRTLKWRDPVPTRVHFDNDFFRSAYTRAANEIPGIEHRLGDDGFRSAHQHYRMQLPLTRAFADAARTVHNALWYVAFHSEVWRALPEAEADLLDNEKIVEVRANEPVVELFRARLAERRAKVAAMHRRFPELYP